MKRSNVKSRIKKDELNPLFHFKDQEEDDKVLTKGVMKQALKSGKLELSNKHLKVGKFSSEADKWIQLNRQIGVTFHQLRVMSSP